MWVENYLCKIIGLKNFSRGNAPWSKQQNVEVGKEKGQCCNLRNCRWQNKDWDRTVNKVQNLWSQQFYQPPLMLWNSPKTTLQEPLVSSPQQKLFMWHLAFSIEAHIKTTYNYKGIHKPIPFNICCHSTYLHNNYNIWLTLPTEVKTKEL